MAAGEVENAPRRRLRLPEGALADMAAADAGLGLAGGKLYAATSEGASFVVCLFDAAAGELVAVIEADRLGRLRTGAASGVAAKHLARRGASSLGVIGCGRQAETQVAVVRAAVPSIEHVVAYCRTPERLDAFCERVGAEAAESHREAGMQDVVVTITSSRDPVLRGEWLRPGALVAAAGANVVSRRELDNAVLERATLRLLRLARAGEARVGRPRRAGRRGRPRLARGARAARGRLGRGRGPSVGRGHRRLQVERPRGLGRGARGRGGSPCAGAGRGDGALGARTTRPMRSRPSPTRACRPRSPPMISGRSRRRRCCSGVSRFCTYLSWRISSSVRPRSCSLTT